MADNVEKIIITVIEEGVKDTKKAMDGLNDSIEDNVDANKKATDEQEAYDKALVGSIKDVQIFGVSMNSLAASFKATSAAVKISIRSLGLFKVALAATGIGLIVLALGALVTFFTRSQEGADKLTLALRVIGNVINVLLDRLSDLGGGLVKLFSGDIKGGLSDMKQSFVGIGEAIQDNIERAKVLEAQLSLLFDASMNLTVQEAAYKQVIAQNREIMNDTNQIMAERLKAGKDALEAEMQLADIRIFNLKLQRDILIEANKESKTRDEDLLAIVELEAQIINAETQRAQSSIRVRNRLQSLEKEAAAETNAMLDARALRDQTDLESRVALETSGALQILGIQKAGLADYSKIKKQELDISAKTAQFNLLLAQEENQALWQGRSALAGGIAALFGQNSKVGKAAAISQAIIDTWAGVNTIIRDPLLPTVAKPAFIAGAIAQGLASVKKITQVELPQVQVVPSPFGDGGMINGNSHAHPSGGVHILAEGGEYVINKRSMALNGVAGLVESINSLGSRGTSSNGVFANGGYVPSNLEQLNLEAAVQAQRSVLVLEDFFSEANTVKVSEDLATL